MESVSAAVSPLTLGIRPAAPPTPWPATTPRGIAAQGDISFSSAACVVAPAAAELLTAFTASGISPGDNRLVIPAINGARAIPSGPSIAPSNAARPGLSESFCPASSSVSAPTRLLKKPGSIKGSGPAPKAFPALFTPRPSKSVAPARAREGAITAIEAVFRAPLTNSSPAVPVTGVPEAGALAEEDKAAASPD